MVLQLLGNRKRGLAFIVSAPAGTGKTTLVNMLTKEFPCVVANVSYTTRKPRQGEIEGTHYHFVNKEEFKKRIEAGEFLEYVCLYEEFYGTSRKWIEERLSAGKHVVLVIDTQGAVFLKDKFPAISIFLKPPSIEELEKRLNKRATESYQKIIERLEIAEQEIEALKYYDYEIVNDNLKVAYEAFKSIFIAEEHRIKNL